MYQHNVLLFLYCILCRQGLLLLLSRYYLPSDSQNLWLCAQEHLLFLLHLLKANRILPSQLKMWQ